MRITTYLKLSPFALLLSGSIQAATVDLRIIETTDLHSNMMDFDYYRHQPTEKFGFTRTATLIAQVRQQVTNSVLVDNGDLIQGSPLADYVVAEGLTAGQTHPVYKVMNQQNYVVGNIGNHEFNFGLEFLKNSLAGAKFPYINANVYDAVTGKPYFQQYIIIDTPVTAKDGSQHVLKIGYIGFVPPQIMQWDKTNLAGKVIVKDIVTTAELLVPEMRKAGADLVVAIPHSGISTDSYKVMAENSVYYLSQVKGIDAITFGHAHGVFPGKNFANIPGVNLEQGTINGVPAVMPGQWGSHVGVIDLTLDGSHGNWKVIAAKAEAQPIYDSANKTALVAANTEVTRLLQDDHQKIQQFVSKPIGKSADDMYSYLVLIQDDPSIQVVNEAQKNYVEHFIQGDPALDGIPVLSALAPFRAGGRKNDPTAYVEVPKGTMIYSHAADLYNYPNLLAVVKVNGENVKQWLECSAGMFKQVDINNNQAQHIINWAEFRTYNFDIIDGVSYQIDITQPARYNSECELINPQANRIINLTWQGKPIDPNAEFLIATNDYRVNTGKFSGTTEKHIVFMAPDEVRAIVAAYISQQTQQHGQVVPTVDNNWQIAPINSKHKLDLRFETSPSDTAKTFIKQKAKYPMTLVGNDEGGFAVYQVDLQAK